MIPQSRREQLISQDVGEELVVYDQQTHVAHRLNGTAALVWRLADGKRTVAEISSILHDTTGSPDDEALVRLALSELDSSGLLVHGLPKIDEPMTRRRLLSLSAALVPVVASIGVPSAQSAQSRYRWPTILEIFPERGPVGGGTSVRIHGEKLDGATKVTFDGIDALAFTVVNATRITATTPPGTAGKKAVAVTVNGLTDTASIFTYSEVTSVTPATGAGAGGTSVTIAGVGFAGATKVTFGGTDAAAFTVVSDTSITATTPAGTTGSVDVVVTLDGGEIVTLVEGFTYAGLNQTFTYNGTDDTSGAPSPQSLVIPAGVTSIVVDAFGARGAAGAASGGTGGLGGRIQTTIAVTPGETLTIFVGGAPPTDAPQFGGFGGGANSFGFGGGGGGASAIMRGGPGGTPLVVAGAGGGGGSNSGGNGGSGGGATGGAGATTNGNGGGGGGTQSAGGAAGTSIHGLPGAPGAFMLGGAGAPGTGGDGGGGGGGYYGGGGGASSNDGGFVGGGGAGGGSSFSSGTSTTTTAGVRSGHGQVTVTEAG